jgi:hypothetical protein
MKWSYSEETGFERTSPVREVNRPGHDVMDFERGDVFMGAFGENHSRNAHPDACSRHERVFAHTLRDRRSY